MQSFVWRPDNESIPIGRRCTPRGELTQLRMEKLSNTDDLVKKRNLPAVDAIDRCSQIIKP